MKKRQIIFPQSQWEAVTSHLSCQSDQEHAAFAYASRCESADRSKLLVDEIQPIPPEELEEQTAGHVIPSAKASAPQWRRLQRVPAPYSSYIPTCGLVITNFLQ